MITFVDTLSEQAVTIEALVVTKNMCGEQVGEHVRPLPSETVAQFGARILSAFPSHARAHLEIRIVDP